MMSKIRVKIAGITSNQYLAALAFFLVFHATVQVSTILLSLLTVSISQLPAIGILLFSIAIGWLTARLFRQVTPTANEDTTPETSRVPMLVLTFAVGIYILIWVSALYRFDTTTDGNCYHIPPIHVWAMRGYVHWLSNDPTSGRMNGYPKAAELVGFVLSRVLGESWHVNTFQLLFLPIGVLAVTWLTRYLGLRSELALACGCALVFLPSGVVQMVSTCVDVSYTACVIATLLLSAVTITSLTRRHLPWKLIPLIGISMGLAVAIKPTGLLLGPIIGVAFLVAAVFAKRDTGSVPRFGLKVVLALFIIGLIVFSVAGFWYVRNYIYGASPLYPVGLSIGKHTIFPGMTPAEAMDEDLVTGPHLKPMSPILRIIVCWLQTNRILGWEGRFTGFGYLWLLGCVPAIVLAVVYRRTLPQQTNRCLWILMGLTFVMFLATPMNWSHRYTLWVHGLGLLALGLIVNRHFRNPAPSRVVRVWLTTVLLLMLLDGSLATLSNLRHCYPHRQISGPSDLLHLQNWKWPVCYLFPEMNGTDIERVLRSRSPIAVGPCTFKQYPPNRRHKMEIYGQLCQPIGSRDVCFLPLSPQESDFAELSHRGIHYVLWDDLATLPPLVEQEAESIQHISGYLFITLP